MQGHNSLRLIALILITTQIVTLGYGISFPVLALSLEEKNYPPSLIGINAAMPALGWLIVTPFLPRLQKSYSSKFLIIGFLVISQMGLLGFVFSDNFTWWLACRLAFGGGLGMFFRLIEYYLNVGTHPKNRGFIIGIYSFLFLLGIAVGSLLQPELKLDGNAVFAVIELPLAISTFILWFLPKVARSRENDKANRDFLNRLMTVLPIAFAGVLAYGLIEDVPAYLLSIYALKLGMPDHIAAYTLTAFAVGSMIFAIPLGLLSDKIGRTSVMVICAALGVLVTITVPFSLSNAELFLGILVLWGGATGGLYAASLALIGDEFSDTSLTSANAAFGTIYAAAAMIGPLFNGTAMQIWEPHGLMVSCGLIFSTFLIFSLIISLRRRSHVATKAN